MTSCLMQVPVSQSKWGLVNTQIKWMYATNLPRVVIIWASRLTKYLTPCSLPTYARASAAVMVQLSLWWNRLLQAVFISLPLLRLPSVTESHGFAGNQAEVATLVVTNGPFDPNSSLSWFWLHLRCVCFVSTNLQFNIIQVISSLWS